MAPNKKQKSDVKDTKKKKISKPTQLHQLKKVRRWEKIVENHSSKQHTSSQNRFKTFCADNELEDPTFIANDTE